MQTGQKAGSSGVVVSNFNAYRRCIDFFIKPKAKKRRTLSLRVIFYTHSCSSKRCTPPELTQIPGGATALPGRSETA